MKTLYAFLIVSLLCVTSYGVDTSDADTRSHKIEDLHNLVTRFLSNITNEELANTLQSAQIKAWDMNNYSMTSNVDDQSFGIDDWWFILDFDRNLESVSISKSIASAGPRSSRVELNLWVVNEQFMRDDKLGRLSPYKDTLNSGVYMIRDWRIQVFDSDGRLVFSTDRASHLARKAREAVNLRPIKKPSQE